MKIAIINGPNLNMLGQRQPHVYGNQSLDEIVEEVKNQFAEIEVVSYQSNIEGELINAMQNMATTCQGILLNAGAYSHTSIALADCVKSIPIPVIGVHISNIYAREKERHTDLLLAACAGGVHGMGSHGYKVAMHGLLYLLQN